MSTRASVEEGVQEKRLCRITQNFPCSCDLTSQPRWPTDAHMKTQPVPEPREICHSQMCGGGAGPLQTGLYVVSSFLLEHCKCLLTSFPITPGHPGAGVSLAHLKAQEEEM